MGKKTLRATLCVSMTAASLLALSIVKPIVPSAALTPTATPRSEMGGEKPIVYDRQAPEHPIVDVSSELIEKDAKSAGYDISDEPWRDDSEYVESMADRLDGIATDTGYAIAIDTSTCRVGIFAASDSEYTLERAFDADLGYIEEETGRTHTFTGEWHIDHRSESIPGGRHSSPASCRAGTTTERTTDRGPIAGTTATPDTRAPDARACSTMTRSTSTITYRTGPRSSYIRPSRDNITHRRAPPVYTDIARDGRGGCRDAPQDATYGG